MSRLGDAKLFDDSKTELDEDLFEEVVKSNYGVYELTFGNVSEGTLSVLPSVIVVVLGAVYKIVFSFRPQQEYVFVLILWQVTQQRHHPHQAERIQSYALILMLKQSFLLMPHPKTSQNKH